MTSTVEVPAGTPLRVVRTHNGTSTVLDPVLLAADGSYTVPDGVGSRGSYTYDVSWPGDANHVGAHSATTFVVKGLTTTITMVTKPGVWPYGSKVGAVFRASGAIGGTMTITSHARGCCVQPTIKTVSVVDAAGQAKQALTLTSTVDLDAAYAGDDSHEPATVHAVLTTASKITAVISRNYGTSGSDKLFHTNQTPRFDITVLPARTSWKPVYTVQRYSGGVWHTAAIYRPERLDNYGRNYVYFYGTFTAGTRYRMQATILPSYGAAIASTPYQYFRFT